MLKNLCFIELNRLIKKKTTQIHFLNFRAVFIIICSAILLRFLTLSFNIIFKFSVNTILTIPKGKIVTTKERKGNWFIVSYNYFSKRKNATYSGWLSGDSLKEYYVHSYMKKIIILKQFLTQQLSLILQFE
ncbi:hypothetical protein [Neobacillus drentensis]|uniref:hypothetical protein n=1 Tax=Neobacillus drentensis TaxID=220684 RepID=UPI003000A28F